MSTGAGWNAAAGAARALPRSRARPRSLPWIDRLTLAAIGLVVVLVTLPHVKGMALRQNELDALSTLRLLSSTPAFPGAAQAATLAGRLAPDAQLRRRLDDLELLPSGSLRRHGYLFDLCDVRPGEPLLRAWPWEHGRTGCGAFVWSPERGLLGHQNADGRFSGPQRPPGPHEVRQEGWLRLRRR